MEEIKHIIFAIHMLGYERMAREQPELVCKYNYGPYVERDLEVKERYFAELGQQQDPGTLYLQLYGAKYLVEEASARLGASHACYVQADSSCLVSACPSVDEMREYYRRLTNCIRAHMEKYALWFNTATVTSEIWGGSFEGYAPGYADAFAQHLGLRRPPRMRFEMTVYDSRFLYGARRWETIALAGTDVEAWVFECYDGSGAAIFQARLSEQWLDKRLIHLNLDPTRVMVCTKPGFTVWPEKIPAKGDPEVTQSFALTTSDSYWIRTSNMNFDDLRDVIKSAIVRNPSPEME